jgi:hypothetical protein
VCSHLAEVCLIRRNIKHIKMSYMVLILLYLAMAQVDLLTFCTLITEFYLKFHYFCSNWCGVGDGCAGGFFINCQNFLSGG